MLTVKSRPNHLRCPTTGIGLALVNCTCSSGGMTYIILVTGRRGQSMSIVGNVGFQDHLHSRARVT